MVEGENMVQIDSRGRRPCYGQKMSVQNPDLHHLWGAVMEAVDYGLELFDLFICIHKGQYF